MSSTAFVAPVRWLALARRRHRLRNLGALAALAALVAGAVLWVNRDTTPAAGAGIGTIVARLVQSSQQPRDLAAYAGLGTWVDGFDFGPEYVATRKPPITPASVDDMAANGVKTLYLQAVRDDPRSPGGVVDPALVAEFLIRAHR